MTLQKGDMLLRQGVAILLVHSVWHFPSGKISLSAPSVKRLGWHVDSWSMIIDDVHLIVNSGKYLFKAPLSSHSLYKSCSLWRVGVRKSMCVLRRCKLDDTPI